MKKDFEFSKLNGQGNDFILIDGTETKYSFSKEQVAKFCDRRFGIGADGLIIAENSSIADFKMSYFNQDGSSAEMCGNGIRCLARFLIEKSITEKNIFDIETLAGVKKITAEAKDGKVGVIKVNMGPPWFRAEEIPVVLENKSDKRKIFDHNIMIDDRDFKVNLVSMGNPHCIVFIDDELEDIPLNTWGPNIENHKIFPNKTNVEFVNVVSPNKIRMRVWERGVGETLACGTGACASAVASIISGKVDDKIITVSLSGGDLIIEWSGNSSDVFLSGEVDYVYDGKYLSE